VASSPIACEERRISAEQPQPTVAHRTITTARRPDHLRLSALVRSRSTQVTAHTSYQLGRGPPKQGHFLPFWRVTRALYYKIAIYSNKRALYSAKRALYPDKRDPYSDKRALYSDRRALYSDRRALYSDKRALHSDKKLFVRVSRIEVCVV